ncbi:MAG: transcription elongation factor GreA [Cognaticolwellia sp.]|jgi:transcription elongation factor GreA|tara:strand:- start:44 stop:520 length:477 start_codon:yes stop_codon:yes gene_type:complete
MAYEYLSKGKLEELKQVLENLMTVERRKAAAAIAEAREKGDLSENAEYDAAKEAQGLLELKISDLSAKMVNARVLDTTNLDTSKITVFTKVKIKNTKTKKVFDYQLVSELEADLKKKMISVTSPIGKGLLGKKPGDIAMVETPRGSMEFEVLEISFDA